PAHVINELAIAVSLLIYASCDCLASFVVPEQQAGSADHHDQQNHGDERFLPHACLIALGPDPRLIHPFELVGKCPIAKSVEVPASLEELAEVLADCACGRDFG